MFHGASCNNDLANTLYGMLIIYCNFPINLIILATKQLKLLKMVIITSPQRQKFKPYTYNYNLTQIRPKTPWPFTRISNKLSLAFKGRTYSSKYSRYISESQTVELSKTRICVRFRLRMKCKTLYYRCMKLVA